METLWKHTTKRHEFSKDLLLATDDLQHYRYRQNINVGNGVLSLSVANFVHEIENGYLKGSRFAPIHLRQTNIIPWKLLDMFASLAVTQSGPEPYLFTVVNPNLISNPKEEMLWELEVRPTDAIPDQVKQLYPNGHGAEISNTTENNSWIKYYDANNRLVWQKNMASQETCRIVESLNELNRIFPGAAERVFSWLPAELLIEKAANDPQIL